MRLKAAGLHISNFLFLQKHYSTVAVRQWHICQDAKLVSICCHQQYSEVDFK